MNEQSRHSKSLLIVPCFQDLYEAIAFITVENESSQFWSCSDGSMALLPVFISLISMLCRDSWLTQGRYSYSA